MPYAVAEPRETERLRLRAYEPRDIEDYADMQTDPEVVRFLPRWPLRTREESAVHFQRRLNQNMLRKAGDFLALALEQKGTGKVIGDVGLLLREEDPLAAEVSWILNTDYRRLGYAHEAALSLVDFAYDRGIKDLTAVIVSGNEPSIRLATKLGLRIVLEDE